jgi:TRAP-type C4-dicarboxylate transport system substrate-binding protein
MIRIAIAALAALAPLSAGAQEPLTVRFAMTAPAAGWSWTRWFDSWIAKVEKDAGGTIKIQTYPGSTLANMTNAYDRTVSGVADMAYSVTGTMRGKFVGTNVLELPSDANGKEGSGALWRLFETGLIAPEFADSVPLYLYVYPQTILHLQKPVTKLADLKGMKIGATSRVSAESITRLGAAPVTTTPAEMYEVLQRGVITGMAVGWNGVLSFKLHEVTNYHLNVEIGSGGGFMIMNKGFHAKLPAQAKTAFEKNAGYAASKAFGVVIDAVAVDQFDTVKAMPGHTQAYLAPEEKARWRALFTPITDEWVKATPNGAAILAAYRDAILKVRAGS